MDVPMLAWGQTPKENEIQSHEKKAHAQPHIWCIVIDNKQGFCLNHLHLV